MGRLTTHVLDTSAGIPARGVCIELHASSSSGCELLATQVTGVDGRCCAPLLEDGRFCKGRYQLTFHLANYFRAAGVTLPEPAFIEEAVVRFGIAQSDQHCHVPLLISPWAYSVYRGG